VGRRLGIHLVLMLALGLLGLGGTGAQQATPTALPADPTITRPFRDAVLFAGPGDTYRQLDVVPAGTDVQIVERNKIGNWLHVMRWDAEGEPTLDGWVLTGYLTLAPNLRFSRVPENREIPDADPSLVLNPDLRALYAVPVMSEIDPSMQEVFDYGQELGNHANVVTKIGDSVTADPIYLNLFSRSDHVLGPYDYLQDTLRFFGRNMAPESIGAKIGMTSYVIFDPMWARSELCEPNETPLDCEYRVRQPSVSMIMFGANDVRHIDVAAFDENMRDIVDNTLQHGIIPVLSTFSYDPNGGYYDQALAFNLAITAIAEDYKIPLINLWSAARVLPEYGLDGDDVHMMHSGFRYLKFDTGHETWYGVSLRNLLTLRMLEEIRNEIDMR
jgi:hypothetical protein